MKMTDKGRLVEILKNRYGIHESTEDLKVVKSPFKEIFIGESACAYIYSKDFNVDRISFWYKLYEHGLPVPEIKTPLSGGMFTRLNDKIVVVSEVLPSSQELWDEDYTKLGKIMAGLHSFGEDYARSKQIWKSGIVRDLTSFWEWTLMILSCQNLRPIRTCGELTY